MERFIYHRLTDCNHSLYGSNRNTSFEASFAMSNIGELFFLGRILDSQNQELFCNCTLSNLDQSFSETYRNWSPAEDFQEFIRDVETLTSISEDSIYFVAPYHDLSLEAKLAPIRPKGYWVSIHFHHFKILGDYKWQDSSTMSINMLCTGEEFIHFLKALQYDLDMLLSQRLEIE